MDGSFHEDLLIPIIKAKKLSEPVKNFKRIIEDQIVIDIVCQINLVLSSATKIEENYKGIIVHN